MKFYWPLIIIVILGLVFAVTRLEPPPPKYISFAAGAEGGNYYKLATDYADALKLQGIEVEILTTGGSLSNLSLLDDGTADVAWVQGGILNADSQNEIAALGGMFFEPLWVFVRADLPIARFSDLQDKRVAIGGEGSGTRAFALTMQAEYSANWAQSSQLPFGGKQARAALLNGDIDAAMFVAAGETSYIQDLLANPQIRLLPIHEAKGIGRRYKSLTATQLFQGVINPQQPLPAQDTPMIASVAQLYVADGLHPAIQSLLLSAAKTIHADGSTVSDIGNFPQGLGTDLPLSKQARNFYERGPTFLRRLFPFAVANFLERAWILAIPILTLMIPLARVAPPLYRWRTRRKIYVWYEDLRQLEAKSRAALAKSEKQLVKQHLSQLQKEIGMVEVPLSYTDDLYRLRSHVAFVYSLVDDPSGQSYGQIDEAAMGAPSIA